MQNVRNEIRFLLNDRPVVLREALAGDMLLDFIRLDAALTGTKEGCAEGDCGACTVLIGRLKDGDLRYEAINACIKPLISCDLTHVVTVEHVSREGLTALQSAMVRHHASQCGFCTPGFVMALYALWMERPRPSRQEVVRALQGNLCRCTGYVPIINAALAVTEDEQILNAERRHVIDCLTEWDDGRRVTVGAASIPADLSDLDQILASQAQTTIVAGATDVGLWVTKSLQDIAPAVFTGNLRELGEINATDHQLSVGAGVSYSEMEPVIERYFPMVADYWSRIGGWQVRNAGTIGGNIANGSPIGDTPPWLIAMGATLRLRSASGRRQLPIEDFFIDYGKQDLRPGEYLEGVDIPLLKSCEHLVVEKVSKRRDEDISSVALGMLLELDGNAISSARIAFGGMAATPKRATNLEAALTGKTWLPDGVADATASLEKDFKPLSDQRASAAYRMRVAKNLILRAAHRGLCDAA